MKLLSIIVLALMMSACGKRISEPTQQPEAIIVDPTFIPYVDMYLKIKGSPLQYNIPIKFTADIEGTVIGTCTRWSDGRREIVIDQAYWYSSYTTENQRISLIFHELGHCDLDRGHIETKRSNGWPTSLMYPMNYGFNTPDANYYFTELFSPQPPTAYLSMHSINGCVNDIEVK